MREKSNMQNGITLIALVVTIVVLLILAGVSLNLVLGNNGIITKSKEAKERSIVDNEKTLIELAQSKCYMDLVEDNNAGYDYADQMQKEIKNNGEENTVTWLSDEEILVTFTQTGHEYNIHIDFNKNDVDFQLVSGYMIGITQTGKISISETKNVNELEKFDFSEQDATIISENGGRNFRWMNGGIGFIDKDDKLQYITYNNFEKTCISDIEGSILNNKKIVDFCYDGYGDSYIALDNEGKIYTWGNNSSGQLGDGTNTNSDLPICISNINENILYGKTITSINVNGTSTCVIDSDGKVYTWGKNYQGKLGNGTSTNSNLPICISDLLDCALNGKKIVKISNGYDTCVALDSDGNIYAWGDNYDGVLGNGTREDSYIPICINTVSENPLNGNKIVDFVWDGHDILALDANGKIYLWGYNNNNKIPEEIEYVRNVTKIGILGWYLIAVDDSGKGHIFEEDSGVEAILNNKIIKQIKEDMIITDNGDIYYYIPMPL